MLRNYFLTALRNLRKNRLFSFINIFGLSIGLTGCLLIYQYVSFETSYNDFHEKADNIYRISYSKEKDGIESFHTVLTYVGVGPLLKENFPEVEEFARLRPASVITANAAIKYEDRIFEEKRVYYADHTVFELFSFELIDGDRSTALIDQYTALVSESTAKKYFGDANPIGETIQHGSDRNYLVTGVFKDVPMNSHIKFDILLAHSTLRDFMPEYWSEDNLTSFHGHLYVQLTPGTDIEDFKAKLPQFVDDYVGGRELLEFGTILYLYPMALPDIHLKSNIQHEAEVNGDENTVKYLSLIAIIILILAWVNNVNQSTARAIDRANEVGVRKSLGAVKKQLRIQFLIESVINSAIAIVIALIMVFLAQPLFDLLDVSYMRQVNIWLIPSFWLVILGLMLTSIVFAGVYPAMVLSSYKPIDVLRGGNYSRGEGAILRKTLVVFQFTASIALIIGTIIVFTQISFLRNLELGINIDQSIVVRAPLIVDSTYTGRVQVFKNELLNNANISSVVASYDIPGREYNSATWFRRINDSDDNGQFMYRTFADENFIEGMGVKLAAGRSLAVDDNEFSIIINEQAREQFGFESAEEALGNEITFVGSDGNFKLNIVGVVENYHHLSPKLDYSPHIMSYAGNIRNYYIIRMKIREGNSGDIANVITAVEDAFKTSFEDNPFSYFFLDSEFEKQYGADKQFGNIFSAFSGLALVVACLGLFGLSSFTVLKRKKEIGIKKVLGSSVGGIVRSFSYDYVKLILVSNIIAWPLIYYIMNQWLDSYASHIALPLWVFPFSGIVVILIAILTVSFHTLKAALANPVDSLKYE